MAQSVNAAGGELKPKPRASSRVSNALKTGVVYGGSAVLTAVNNITPHIAGAVDILVIEQPDGSRKATPFYVRFGKYTALRERQRNVKLYINDELAPFDMHIGMYGQAYFATEGIEVRGAGDEDEHEALLAGMMSPPSGYSSGTDEPSPKQDGGESAVTLSDIRQCKEVRRTSGMTAAGTASGSRGARVPLPALGVEAGASGNPSSAAATTASLAATTAMAGVSDDRSALGDKQLSALSQAQLAPALSVTDRTESFLSARETLAGPLGDELIVSMLGGASLTAPDYQPHPGTGAQQASFHSVAPPQRQGPGVLSGAYPSASYPRDSVNSLGTVSEGTSPCGWSEDEEETAAGTAWRPAEAEAASPVAIESVQDQDTMLPLSSEPQLQQDQMQVAATAHLPAMSQCQSQGQMQWHHHHHASLQQPFHQQLGFPENASAGFSAKAATNSVPEPEGVAAPLRPVSSPTKFEGGCSGPLDTQLGGRGLNAFAADAWPSLEHSIALGATAPLVPAGAATVPLQSSQPLSHMGIPSAAWDVHRSSPGSVFDVLSTAPRTDDCCAGQGQGFHSAVSLLSCSLRDSGGGGSGFSGGIGGHFETSGAGRSSSDLLGAKGDVAPASATAVARSPSGIDGVLLANSGTVDGPIGLIAAAAVAAGASVTRPLLAVDPHKEQSVKLSLTATHDCGVRVSLVVLPLPSTAPACIGPTGSHRGAFSSGGGSREAAEGGSPSMSDGGYLGDGEQGSVAAAAAVRQQHHGSHHHHYHYAHGHGHLHSRHCHNGLLHSTSAPLPSSSIHVAGAIGAETAATVVGAAVEVRASADTTARNGMPVHGIELSLCGDHLKRSMPYSEACTLFDMHRVTEEVFFSRFHEISGDPRLTIRLSNGVIFPCQQLSYGLLGLLAFGTWRLPPGTPSWGPEGVDVAGASEAAATAAAAAAAAAAMLAAAAAVAQGAGVAAADAPKGGSAGAAVATASNATTPKKGQAAAGAGTGSWRLWMFGARREGGRTSTVGCNSSVSGAAACISARSPPLTSPVSERTVVNPSVSIDVYNVPQPLLATGQARPLLSGQPYTLEGSSAATAIAATDQTTGGQLPAGGSSSSAGAAVSRKISRSQSCNVVTKKSLTPTAEQLAVLPLKHGQNTITYKVGASELRAYVYFLPWRTRIVISDIDGTITKSDVLGHLLPAMGLDWSHPGIAKLLTNIRQNNYLIMYLSSRSIGQANITRDFINTLVQGEHRMPLGPVIISPHGLLPSLYREMILRRPHEFKIATLQDIRALFPADWNPFYGGFGNRDTDEISYREVGVQASRIFIINPRGELRQPADSSPREELPANSNSSATMADAAKAQSQEDAAVSADGGAVAEQLSDIAVAPAAQVASQLSPSATVGTRELSSRSGGAGGSFGRRGSGSTVATPTSMHLSTLSAINELVHDIFPPLRGSQPMTPVGDRRDESSGAQLHEDVGADATVGQDSGTCVRMGEGKEEAPEEGNDAGEEGDNGAAADGAVPAERSPDGEPNGSQPTGVDKGGDSCHRGAATAAAALVGPVCETGCSGSTEPDAVAKRQVRNLNSSSEGKQSPGESQSVATPRSAAPPHSSSPAASMTGDQQTAPVDDVDTAVAAHAVAPCEVSSGLLDHGEASGAVDAPINFRGEAVVGAAASCSIDPSATTTSSSDAANRSAVPAVGGSCSVSIPGIAPGAAVVDEVVATAMPLPA